jgi:hypothetical protein
LITTCSLNISYYVLLIGLYVPYGCYAGFHFILVSLYCGLLLSWTAFMTMSISSSILSWLAIATLVSVITCFQLACISCMAAIRHSIPHN